MVVISGLTTGLFGGEVAGFGGVIFGSSDFGTSFGSGFGFGANGAGFKVGTSGISSTSGISGLAAGMRVTTVKEDSL